MIKDDDAEKAADFLRDNAKKAGELRAKRLYLEEVKKSKLAIIKIHSDGKSNADREDAALASPEYDGYLKEWRDAVQKDEEMRGLLKAAEHKIEVWRSLSANVRGKI